jgi:Ribosomal protein L13
MLEYHASIHINCLASVHINDNSTWCLTLTITSATFLVVSVNDMSHVVGRVFSAPYMSLTKDNSSVPSYIPTHQCREPHRRTSRNTYRCPTHGEAQTHLRSRMYPPTCFPELRVADCGDNVVVTNAQYLLMTGAKTQNKVYYRHSGRPGQLKVIPLQHLVANKVPSPPSPAPSPNRFIVGNRGGITTGGIGHVTQE